MRLMVLFGTSSEGAAGALYEHFRRLSYPVSKNRLGQIEEIAFHLEPRLSALVMSFLVAFESGETLRMMEPSSLEKCEAALSEEPLAPLYSLVQGDPLNIEVEPTQGEVKQGATHVSYVSAEDADNDFTPVIRVWRDVYRGQAKVSSSSLCLRQDGCFDVAQTCEQRLIMVQMLTYGRKALLSACESADRAYPLMHDDWDWASFCSDLIAAYRDRWGLAL